MPFIEKYIKEPLDYATSDLTKILIGGLMLSFIQILLILTMGRSSVNHPSLYSFLLLSIKGGYCIGAIKNTLKGMDTLPDWSNFIEIIIWGFRGISAFFLVLLGLFFLRLILVYGLLTPYLWEKIVYPIVLFLVILYSPLAVVNLAKEGFFGFFDFSNILKKISLKYLIILVLYFLIYSLFVIILTPLLAYSNTINQIILSYTIGHIIFFPIDVMLFRAIAKYHLEKEIN